MTTHGEAASKDPAFNVIKPELTGIYIWRIETFKLAVVSRELFGKFFDGDAYIVYSSSERGQVACCDEKPRPPRGKLEIHLHFWIGVDATQDEAGVAAIKIVELDTLLGGAPIQHREIQGYESKRFLSYFKDGIRYLKGGVASGFSIVTNKFRPRLFHVKGKRQILVREMHEVSWKSMNEADVYVLDCLKFIYVWTGCYSNYQERIQGAKFATKLKSEHGLGHVIVLEDGKEDLLEEEEKFVFNQCLPLDHKQILPISAAPKDEIIERKLCSDLKLYKCSDEDGTLKVEEVKTGPLFQEDLNSNDSFIIDNSPDSIWVWIGKNASKKEREEGLRNAQGFIKKKKYSFQTRVTRIIDGGEPEDFKTLFNKWHEKEQTNWKYNYRQHKPTVQMKFDASTLHQQPKLASSMQLFDDGSGKKEIWRIKKFELVDVPKEEHGMFYSGDCYIVLYAYNANETQNYVIYYWIGQQASTDEAGTAALKTIEIDQELQGKAVHVRIIQGKEPPNFMNIFGGKIVIFEGGFASSFDGKNFRDKGKKSSQMLQVISSSDGFSRAVEVDFKARSLNSNDCFVVMSGVDIFLWCGRGSSGDERELAKTLCKDMDNPVLICEGHENEKFWNILGGRELYADSLILKEEKYVHHARLFHCSNATGRFIAEEIFNFNQSDLISEDVMLLDAWDTLFVWVGNFARKEEVIESETLLFEYLKTDPAGRDEGTTIFKIKQGFEPPNFTGFFGAWNNQFWNDQKAKGNNLSAELEAAAPGATILLNPVTVGNGVAAKRSFPLSSLLVKDPDRLPTGVDPTCKEKYLCDLDFMRVFEMDRSTFEVLPYWKQLDWKKQKGLF